MYSRISVHCVHTELSVLHVYLVYTACTLFSPVSCDYSVHIQCIMRRGADSSSSSSGSSSSGSSSGGSSCDSGSRFSGSGVNAAQ